MPSEFRIDHQKEVPEYDRALDSLANLLEGDGHCVAVAIRPDTGQLVIGSSFTPNYPLIAPGVDRLVKMCFRVCSALESGSPDLTPKQLDALAAETLETSNKTDIETLNRHKTIIKTFLEMNVHKAKHHLKAYAQQMRQAAGEEQTVLDLISKFERGNPPVTDEDMQIMQAYFSSDGEKYQKDIRRAQSTLEIKRVGYIHDLKKVIAYAKTPEGQSVFRRRPNMVPARPTARGKTRHAELEVAAYILRETRGQLPNYIGISKLSCATCAECLRCIYGRGVEKKIEGSPHPFFIRGMHGYVYRPSRDGQQILDVPEEIQHRLGADFAQRLARYPIMPSTSDRRAANAANEALRTMTSSSSERSEPRVTQASPARKAAVEGPASPPPAMGAAAAGPPPQRSSLEEVAAEQQAGHAEVTASSAQISTQARPHAWAAVPPGVGAADAVESRPAVGRSLNLHAQPFVPKSASRGALAYASGSVHDPAVDVTAVRDMLARSIGETMAMRAPTGQRPLIGSFHAAPTVELPLARIERICANPEFVHLPPSPTPKGGIGTPGLGDKSAGGRSGR